MLHLEEMALPMPTPPADIAMMAAGGQKMDATAATEARAKLPMAVSFLSVKFGKLLFWKLERFFTSEVEERDRCTVLRLNSTPLIYTGTPSITS